MNFGELQEELGRRVVEVKGGESFWDLPERKFALNRSTRDMARELLLTRAAPATTATVVGQQNYSLGAAGWNIQATFFGLAPITLGRAHLNVRSALIFYDGVQDEPLLPKTVEWLYDNVPSWRTDPNGRPRYYFPPEGGEVISTDVGLYPKPDTVWATSLRLHYLYRPADMTLDSHVPFNAVAGTGTPYHALEAYHDAIVWRAVWTLLGDDDTRLADRIWRLYQLSLGKAKRAAFFGEDQEPEFVRIAPRYRGGGKGGTW